MSELPLGYEKIAPATWVYLSSLLMIGLFFKFNRLWSVRNLDLILLALLAPGLLLVVSGASDIVIPDELSDPQQVVRDSETAPQEIAHTVSEKYVRRAEWRQLTGFIWLFVVGIMWLVRLLTDPTMTRRPLLEPNLATGGLVFLGCSLFVFLTINVIMSPPTEADIEAPRSAELFFSSDADAHDEESMSRRGPGYALIFMLPSISSVAISDGEPPTHQARVVIAKVMAILAHLAIVIGMVMIGYHHFDNFKMGAGTATLYLMLPYTAIMTGRVEHVIPAALLVWAVYCYRHPLTAGILVGLAAGVVYYPLFLLPLWLSFYWHRGLGRFGVGVASTLAVLALSLAFVSRDVSMYWTLVQKMFGIWWPVGEGLEGLWGLGWEPMFRLPFIVAFAALSISFALWPAQKNLGTLICCSAALMVATQFWHGYGGGLYMAWYLPLALLTIFRPNLDDRIALTVLAEGWLSKHRKQRNGSKQSIAAFVANATDSIVQLVWNRTTVSEVPTDDRAQAS